jgi:hypothetical protein
VGISVIVRIKVEKLPVKAGTFAWSNMSGGFLPELPSSSQWAQERVSNQPLEKPPSGGCQS